MDQNVQRCESPSTGIVEGGHILCLLVHDAQKLLSKLNAHQKKKGR